MQKCNRVLPALKLGLLLIAISMLALTGCGKQGSPTEAPAPVAEEMAPGTEKNPKVIATQDSIDRYFRFANYIETGDLKDIRKHGTIRFVNLTGASENELPRQGITTLRHIELANKLAKRLKLEPRWIQARNPAEAIEILRSGRADVLAYNLTVTEARREWINFTIPIRQTHQVLVTGSAGPDIDNPKNLRDVEFIVPVGSTNAETARHLAQQFPDSNLTTREVVVFTDRDTVIDQINESRNRVAILDDYFAQNLLTYRDDVRLGAAVSDRENIAWGLRKESSNLLKTVNNYLTRNLVKQQGERNADWKEIKQSGVIRFLTYNGSTTYFLWKGVLMGFDYDLAKAFADSHKLQLQVVVVPSSEKLIDWLKAGRGDFAGASITITEQRKDQGVSFTTPYRKVSELIVSNKKNPPIKTIQDLNGRTLTLRAYSSYIETAKALQNSGIGVNIKIAPDNISSAQILNMVADGLLDATITDPGGAKIAASLQPDLKAGIPIGDPNPQGWMVMNNNWHLLQKLNKFLAEFMKTDQYRKKLQAYFEPEKRYTQRLRARIIPGQNLSPYDDLVKKVAQLYDFDWRMVVAQMWQESNFNPKALSPVGAQGLMQVMPATAQEMGFPPPLFDPERAINAGVKYLDWVRKKFDPTLPTVNKLWFTLASYNAGYGHLLDAQKLAKELGLDPNIWFGNVEVAMLKLAEPQYFEKARYGYVRGSEPVQYVHNISNLYKAYVEVATGDVSEQSSIQKTRDKRSSIRGSKFNSSGQAQVTENSP